MNAIEFMQAYFFNYSISDSGMIESTISRLNAVG